jgi:hypothetical protein
MATSDIERIVASWDLSGTSTLNPGATPEDLKRVRRRLERNFPNDFIALYEHCDGGEVLHGNIRLYPLDGEDLSVLRASAFLRRYDWPIPPEVIVFASNGQGESLGLWLPKDGSGRPFVIEVGEIFEDDSLSVTGTSLTGFLRGRSAYYLLALQAPPAALEALGLPVEFKRSCSSYDLNHSHYEALIRWANPDLPQHPVSPYESRLTAEDVRRLAGQKNI